MTQELMQRLGIQSPETAEKVEQFLLALEERNRLLTEKSAALEREKTLAEEALQNAKKIAAMEKAILEAGGKNAKAILALIDADEVTMNEKGELEGLDLEAVKAEAPYLFNEKEEKTKGTGGLYQKENNKGKRNCADIQKSAEKIRGREYEHQHNGICSSIYAGTGQSDGGMCHQRLDGGQRWTGAVQRRRRSEDSQNGAERFGKL